MKKKKKRGKSWVKKNDSLSRFEWNCGFHYVHTNVRGEPTHPVGRDSLILPQKTNQALVHSSFRFFLLFSFSILFSTLCCQRPPCRVCFISERRRSALLRKCFTSLSYFFFFLQFPLLFFCSPRRGSLTCFLLPPLARSFVGPSVRLALSPHSAHTFEVTRGRFRVGLPAALTQDDDGGRFLGTSKCTFPRRFFVVPPQPQPCYALCDSTQDDQRKKRIFKTAQMPAEPIFFFSHCANV